MAYDGVRVKGPVNSTFQVSERPRNHGTNDCSNVNTTARGEDEGADEEMDLKRVTSGIAPYSGASVRLHCYCTFVVRSWHNCADGYAANIDNRGKARFSEQIWER